MFSQIALNFWKDEYEADWIIGASNEFATQRLFGDFNHVFLTGPSFCGKKHIACKIPSPIEVFLLKQMSDMEIIAKYDELKNRSETKSIVRNAHSETSTRIQHRTLWIGSTDMTLSKDVKSRLAAMELVEIFELTEDMLYSLLLQRLQKIGFADTSNFLLNYTINRLPRSYEVLENFIKYVKKENAFSKSVVQRFVDSMMRS